MLTLGRPSKPNQTDHRQVQRDDIVQQRVQGQNKWAGEQGNGRAGAHVEIHKRLLISLKAAARWVNARCLMGRDRISHAAKLLATVRLAKAQNSVSAVASIASATAGLQMAVAIRRRKHQQGSPRLNLLPHVLLHFCESNHKPRATSSRFRGPSG